MVNRGFESGLTLILRAGVLISAVLMVAGLTLHELTGDVSLPTGSVDPRWIFFGDPFLAPSHVLFLGFMALLATPVLRVAYSMVSFGARHDYVYAAMTGLVLLVLLFSFTLGSAA